MSMCLSAMGWHKPYSQINFSVVGLPLKRMSFLSMIIYYWTINWIHFRIDILDLTQKWIGIERQNTWDHEVSILYPCPYSINLLCILQAALGSALHWRVLSAVGCIYSVIFLVANMFLPETPYYVLMTSTNTKARNTLQKFRANDYNIDREMESLLHFRDAYQLHK